MRSQLRIACVLGSVFSAIAMVILSGCETADNPLDQIKQREAEWYAALNNLKAGIGLTEAAEYHGGSVPHKMNAVYDLAIPTNWFGRYQSVEDMQLGLFYSETTTDTGLTKTYYFISTPVLVRLQHVTYSFQLREARSGELLGTLVLEGDRKFNRTYDVKMPAPHEITRPDDVDYSKLTNWLRPYVE